MRTDAEVDSLPLCAEKAQTTPAFFGYLAHIVYFNSLNGITIAAEDTFLLVGSLMGWMLPEGI